MKKQPYNSHINREFQKIHEIFVKGVYDSVRESLTKFFDKLPEDTSRLVTSFSVGDTATPNPNSNGVGSKKSQAVEDLTERIIDRWKNGQVVMLSNIAPYAKQYVTKSMLLQLEHDIQAAINRIKL